MEVINQYFGDVVLLKVENKEGFSIYAAALNSAYGDGRKQYVLAFVPDHLSILEKAYLRDLQWENVQTRTLTNGYKLPTGNQMPAQKWAIPKGVENFMFSIKNRDESKSRYTADGHSLELVLIHDPKKKSQYQYHNKINLLAALSTFRCVISNIYSPGTPISELPRKLPFPAPKDPMREDSSRILYQTATGPIKSAIRYQSVAAASAVSQRPIRMDDLSSAASPDGKGKNSMPLGASKMRRQTNYPHPWTKGSIPGQEYVEERNQFADMSPVFYQSSPSSHQNDKEMIDSSFDLIH